MIRTPRLDLLPASLEHLQAELRSPAAFSALLEAEVPGDWPPGEYDREAVDFFLARLEAEGPSSAGWYVWYALLRPPEGGRRHLVASAGFYGPPAGGRVEIGYSLLPCARGRGLAAELVTGLTGWAFGQAGVLEVIAHAADDNLPSQRVLARSGFLREGPGQEPGTSRYRKPAPGPERVSAE